LPTADLREVAPDHQRDQVEQAGLAEQVRYAVLCGPEDASAVWAAGALAAHGLPVRLVTTEELVYSTSFTHTLTAAGVVRTAVRLRDGSVVGPHLLGTLNRVTWIPSDHLAGASVTDREYAVQELFALLTSVFHGLPGTVLGRPDARGLCGAWWRPAEWMVEASRAGLRCVGHRTGMVDALPADRVTVLAIQGRVVDGTPAAALPEEVRDGCARLAGRHGSGLLGIDLVPHGGSWLFAAATPVPDLRVGGPMVVAALAEALASGAPAPGVGAT
jgi:hypothetical protein